MIRRLRCLIRGHDPISEIEVQRLVRQFMKDVRPPIKGKLRVPHMMCRRCGKELR